MCIQSNNHSKQTSNERILWFSELQKLKVNELGFLSESIELTNHLSGLEHLSKNVDPVLHEIVLEANLIMAEIDNFEKYQEAPQFSQVHTENISFDFIEHLDADQLGELTHFVKETFFGNELFS